MKLGLLDHIGYRSQDDATTRDVVIAAIGQRVPNAELIGFSLIPNDTTKKHAIPCYPIRWGFLHCGEREFFWR